ncbi:anti-sigma factor antagonist [Rathayibacter sp. VKM Ac-2804]|jgi:anti-sigma B factor antagonist|uniref:STAS domain-containing protein n=1 Tax=unclassified Rathayibacter TaxID=2609250 RepID=UPI00132EDAA5|nr:MULTISPECIES: STAS domain-containing protein [unclassified Rathayibacter]NRG42572.1 STAS domain-containing protein [Rathayibacter sp. VKM Ac-2835]QHF24488.1 anti-sigma factor antagonist [Rathayibacter sp. VKM Ac-2804]
MTFTTEKIDPDIAVVTASGKLNMVAAPQLRETVRRAIEESSPRIVVDLGAVDFLDSSGLGALVACLKTARQAGGDLRIAAPSAQVMMVLQLSNLDRVLARFDSPGDAYRD